MSSSLTWNGETDFNRGNRLLPTLLSVALHAALLSVVIWNASPARDASLRLIEVTLLDAVVPSGSLTTSVSIAKPAKKTKTRETARPSPETAPVETALPGSSAQVTGNAAARRGNSIDNAFGEREVDIAARVSRSPRPRYPRTAFEEGIEGDVELFLSIDSAGAVARAEIVKKAGHGFDEAAIEAAHLLRFSPALKDSQAVAVNVHWTCHFRIAN